MENQNHLKQRETAEPPLISPPPASPAVKSVQPPLDPPSSPSHEFSFHTPDSLSTNTGAAGTAGTAVDTRKLLDFAPADDIFLHGHLLPLHLVSIQNAAFLCIDHNETDDHQNINADATAAVSTAVIDGDGKDRKYFSFGWLKNFLRGSGGEGKQGRRRRRKKYAGLGLPFLYLKEWRQRWRGVFWAPPASSRTSPANSGLLVASSEGRTLEELQNAIHSAITHCKNSAHCR